MLVSHMSTDELRAEGATPVIVECEPSNGWPDWCRRFVRFFPPEAVQAHQNVLAVMVAMTHAQQMGFAAGGPAIDLDEAAMMTACAAQHGIRPHLDLETVRRIVLSQWRVARGGVLHWPGPEAFELEPDW